MKLASAICIVFNQYLWKPLVPGHCTAGIVLESQLQCKGDSGLRFTGKLTTRKEVCIAQHCLVQ